MNDDNNHCYRLYENRARRAIACLLHLAQHFPHLQNVHQCAGLCIDEVYLADFFLMHLRRRGQTIARFAGCNTEPFTHPEYLVFEVQLILHVFRPKMTYPTSSTQMGAVCWTSNKDGMV